MYCYDTMHLTEVSQRLNKDHHREVTNQDPFFRIETFCRMVLVIKGQSHRGK